MKKFTLLFAFALVAFAPMFADEWCGFVAHVFPGQADNREELDIKAEVQMGTVVETGSWFIDELKSSDPSVISVSCANESCTKIIFMALKGGTATVSYRQMGNNGKEDCYTYHSIEYTVTKADPVAQFKFDGEIATEAYVYLNDFNPTLSAEFLMPTPLLQDGKVYTLNKKVPVNEILFESTHPEIAYMDESGKLQLVAKGQTTITASWAGNESWNAIKTQIDIYVSEPLYLRVAGKRVTRYNMEDILGDGKAVYDSLNHTLTLNNIDWDFEDHDIDAKYGAIEYWGPCDTFLIVLNGINTIANATIGINTKTHNREKDLGKQDLYIRSVNDGILRCSGEHTEILVDGYLGVEENANIQISCNSRWETAVVAEGMWVTDGCKVVISSEGEKGIAVDVPYLFLDEHVYLQGCEFKDASESPSEYGFYNEEGDKAWMVAILSEKVEGYGEAETPDNDKETSINISNTETSSSEDAEDIAMISLGENDNYNEEQQQLELSTTLSEKEVKDALSLFGPGANALKYMLPGSISFFIPAGKGSIQIECQTFLGKLNIQLEGLPAYALSQAVMGWAKVDYDVEVDTYVVIYLTKGIFAAPAHIVAAQHDEPGETAGAFIKGLKITPKKVIDEPTAIDSIEQENEVRSVKYFENGQLIILKNGIRYNAQGKVL